MLAAAASGRSSEQRHPQDSIHRSSTQDPFKSPKSTTNGRTPSISPLSNTSKSHNDSAMSSAGHPNTMSNGDGPHPSVDHEIDVTTADRSRRDRSSSLSDIDGSISEQENEQSASDEGSTPLAGDEDDSEAETERIKPTPQKGRNMGRLSIHGGLQVLGEDAISDADSTRTGDNIEETRNSTGLAGRKRKRTAIQPGGAMAQSDETDSDAALARKRGIRISNPTEDMDVDENDLSGGRMEQGEAEEAIEESDIPMAGLQSPTKTHARKSKSHGKSHKKQPAGSTLEEDGAEVEEPEEAEDDGPEELDPIEVALRDDALNTMSRVSSMFGQLKSKMHANRILEAEAELAQLQQPHSMHPEFIRQLQAVTERRDTKIQQEMKLHQYKKQALRTSTIASRSQLLSQYMQDARDVRERILYELGKQWYDIQKERRAAEADAVGHFAQKFPTKRSDQVRQQAKYNTEVSILSGIAKHVGFPAAPEICVAKQDEVNDDLKAMKITRRPPQQFYAPDIVPKVVPTPTIPTSEHLAQEEFLKHTPWANPHHPIHSQSRTPSAFGNRAVSAVQPTPQPNLLNRPSSTISTPQIGSFQAPGSDQRPPGSNDTVGLPSDPPSSVLAAPPTADRIRLIPFDHAGDTSPTAHVKRAPGAKRDFSGLSSTSTIDARSDAGLTDGRLPGMPMDGPPSHQVFATSALHGQESQG